MENTIIKHIKENLEVKEKILNDERFIKNIVKIAKLLVEAYKTGNKLLVAGNGGSAADAQHIAGELVSKLYLERPALNAVSLTVNTSVLTAIGNDYNYEKTFARQVEAFGVKGDVFLGLSTSGNSKNVIEAIFESKKRGLKTIGFVGEVKCEMDEICDYIVKIPSAKTPIIQESHIMLGHLICGMVEEALFKK